MSARENILERLRQNTREAYDMPDLTGLKPITYSDPVEEFKTKTTTTAGAQLVEMKAGDDLNAIVRQAYPDAKVIASNLPGVEAQLNPDTVGEAQELERVDVGVIAGTIGVAENACIWIPQTMKEKAICFISEELVILLDRKNIVNNMHEGYKRIRVPELGYGCWISGPSKTADIEQALVMGAQAARGVTVLIID